MRRARVPGGRCFAAAIIDLTSRRRELRLRQLAPRHRIASALFAADQAIYHAKRHHLSDPHVVSLPSD